MYHRGEEIFLFDRYIILYSGEPDTIQALYNLNSTAQSGGVIIQVSKTLVDQFEKYMGFLNIET